MNRRNFLGALVATASGLLLPEPKRVYSFAKELKVPGVEDEAIKLTGWHKFEISWDGTIARGSIDERVVLEEPLWPPQNGIFFEYDSSSSDGWRCKLGETPMEKPGLRVERGHAVLIGDAPRQMETFVRFPESSQVAKFRMGWG